MGAAETKRFPGLYIRAVPPPEDLEPVPFDDELFHRAHAMAATGRVVLGVCGAPGAGSPRSPSSWRTGTAPQLWSC